MEQIYAGLGLGVKFKLTDRISLALEGKNTTYNFNAAKYLLTDADKISLGITDADTESNRLYSWSVQASLQFYLGGNKMEEETELDRAYRRQFQGGFKGLRLIVEPSVGHINFDGASALRDSYVVGGFLGMDFNQYVEFRAFYFKSASENALDFNWQPLQLYGLEFRANLNDGNSVIPYLTFGGGRLGVQDGYNDNIDLPKADSSMFESAGVGLNIPLAKNIAITGAAKYLITSGEDVQDIQNTEGIQSHFMYNAGLKFAIGAKSKSPEAIYQDNLEEAKTIQKVSDSIAYQKRAAKKAAAHKERIETQKKEYNTKIDSLNTALETSRNTLDAETTISLLEEKKKVQDDLKQVEDVEQSLVTLSQEGV
ncbi:outer membrane beta-barrel protein [Flavobacteriaceae bacterium GSB9]|nr:outer membrane beta-barrel protein [Flavobacteriaceae bacterium GSB9]